ncbi:MAG: hypothetical protein NC350_03340 [Corallococcus sp.]|nr:hypothetical protein [Corallococcus sp.]
MSDDQKVEVTRISVHPNEKNSNDPVVHIYYSDGTDERVHTNDTPLPGTVFTAKPQK